MSSLQRYKKPGGFLQILSLIETFGPQKKSKFLEMIELESPEWAKMLREKMLSLERIFSWPDEVVFEVFNQLPSRSLAIVLQTLKEEERARIHRFFAHADLRRLSDAIGETRAKPDEVTTILVKVVEGARRMLQERVLHAERFDEGLLIQENVESFLEEQQRIQSVGGGHGAGHGAHGQASQSQSSPRSMHAPSRGHANGHGHPNSHGNSSSHASAGGASETLEGGGTAGSGGGPSVQVDVVALQRSIKAILKENQALKDEVRLLREKLEQIRKIA